MIPRRLRIHWRPLFWSTLLLLIAYALWIEPNWIKINQYTLNPHTEEQRVRVVQLSDLHLRKIGRREASIIQSLTLLKPDLIILSGDVIDRPDTLPILDDFLTALGPVPKVAVLGNWEYWATVDLQALRKLYEEKHHTTLLINERVTFDLHSTSLEITGLDDFTAGHPKLKSAQALSDAKLSLLIQHSPGWFDQPIAMQHKLKFDLCLSGHTHGGQITLFGLPIWHPQGSGTFSSGFYEHPLCTLYVSQGIGTSILPARFGARPEIAVFNL